MWGDKADDVGGPSTKGRSWLSGVDCAKAESRRREGELHLRNEVEWGLFKIPVSYFYR